MREQNNYRREKVWRTADEHTMESVFFEPPMETKIGAKNRRVWEIGGRGIVLEWVVGNDFWFELSGGLKKWDSRNRDSTVV